MLGTSSLLASCTERLAIVLRVFESSDRQLKLMLPALSDFGFVVCLIFVWFFDCCADWMLQSAGRTRVQKM